MFALFKRQTDLLTPILNSIMEQKYFSANPTLSVMDRLRLETKLHHTQTEHIPAMKRLFASDYSLAEYQQHLEKIYGYLRVIEPLLLETIKNQALQDFFRTRNRCPKLESDLFHFGLTAENLAALPCSSRPDFIHDLPEVLGVYYVLEGSRLGGQFIFKHLTQQFGDAVANKLQFYQGDAEHTHTHWQTFCTLLNAQFPNPSQPQIDNAVNAAKLTFDSLTNWLKK